MVELPADYVPEFESLKDLLLDMARERSVDRLLRIIVERFAGRPHLALARIWLMGPADRCPTCSMAPARCDRSRCLHLVASDGNPASETRSDVSRLEGPYARVPLSEGAIGMVAAAGRSHHVPDAQRVERGLIDRTWARAERIVAFAAEPLVHQGEVLGVVAIFVRVPFPDSSESRSWLRLVADHAAIAIANARAFAENERLRERIEVENAYLRAEVVEAQPYRELIGDSPPMQNLRRQFELVAPTDASVLVVGESGTGKELAAREIHRRSTRAHRPLITVDCASIPRTLHESELFGHVKGAFTGAIRDRTGRFELADGGTLFLDEVGEIPLELQSQLLRVLQEGQFERVGDDHTRQVDVRIIAASNRDLSREVAAGRFREDLYYRLNVLPVVIAPLRERVDDIPLLAKRFLEAGARRLKQPLPELSREHLDQLKRHRWPGNVRELQNVIERALIISEPGDLRFDFGPSARLGSGAESPSARAALPFVPMAELRRRERENLRAAVTYTKGKVHGPRGAAEVLGMKPTTLLSRLKALELTRHGQDLR